MNNLFADIPATTAHEIMDTLLQRPCLRVERILSTGQSSPEGFWYEQAEHEWVLLLQGEAALRFEGEARDRPLKAGDYLQIDAGVRHRVSWTSQEPPCIWLCLFFPPEAN